VLRRRGRVRTPGARAKKEPPTTAELREYATQLEQRQQETGAPSIEQDRPGLFRGLVDLLSRFNYAAAGGAQEWLEGRPISDQFSRAFTEVFSGLGSLQGDKKAWGQVLEEQGFGTTTLADVFPVMDGTWFGKWGSRGAVGMALDIATDPLTYVTFGTGKAATTLPKAGKFVLSKAGDVGLAREVGEQFAKGVKVEDAWKAAKEAFEKKLIDPDGTILRPEWLQKGGMRIFGQHIPGSDRVIPMLTDATKTALTSVPGGADVLRGVSAVNDGIRKSIGALFSPFGRMVGAPTRMRSVAEKLHRDFVNASTAHKLRYKQIWNDINKRFKALEKSDAGLGKKFYEVREGTAAHVFTPEQEKVYNDIVTVYDEMFDAGRRLKLFTDEDYRKDFFAHFYLNDPEEFSEVWSAIKGSRDFAAFGGDVGAEAVTKRLNQITETLNQMGQVVKKYPALKPDYDVMRGLGRYMESHSTKLASRAWSEEIVNTFGKELTEHIDFEPLFQLGKRARDLPIEDRTAIDGALYRFMHPNSKRGVGKHGSDAYKNWLDDLDARLPTMTPDGRKELFRSLIREADSATVVTDFMQRWEQRWFDDFPRLKAIKEGDIEDHLRKHYGEEARYVFRTGGMWGDKGVLLPKFIVDDFENISSKVINTREYKELRKLLQLYDWVNNTFKTGVYMVWPGSATRDAMSNVFLSGMDIGVGALDPKMYRDTLGLMFTKGDGIFRTKTGIEYEWKTLRRLMREYGVAVPGERFMETTGKGLRGRKFMSKVAEARGGIENTSRVQLWLNHVRRGMDPRDAADRVNQFLFDYNEVSPFFREVVRRVFPFATWTYKSAELFSREILTHPGRIINQVKPFRGRTNENESMVKWEADALKVRLDGDGKTVRMLNGIDLPIRTLDTFWAGDAWKTMRQQIGMVAPWLKAPFELSGNVEFFLGRTLDRKESGAIGRLVENLPTPKPVKDWLGYQKSVDAAGRPRYTFDGRRLHLLFNTWFMSRALTTSDRAFREYTKDENWSALMLDFLTNIRMKELNLDEQMRRRFQERIRLLEQSLIRRGEMREYRKVYTPKAQ